MSFITDAVSKVTKGVATEIGAYAPDAPSFGQRMNQEASRRLGFDVTENPLHRVTFADPIGHQAREIQGEEPSIVGDYQAEQSAQAARNYHILVSRGFDQDDALHMAAAPGILDLTENVEQTAEWAAVYRAGQEMMRLGPSHARDLWETFDPLTQARMKDMGFDPDLVESKHSALGQAVDLVAGVAEDATFGVANAAGRALVRGMGGTIEMAEDIVEQTVQRGGRAIDLAIRQSVELRQGANGGLTVNNGRVMTDPTAVTAGQQRWHNAWKVVGDGDNTFRPGTGEKMLEIAGGNRDAVEVAKLLAAGKSREQIIERLEIPDDDAARTEAFIQLGALERNPVIQQLIAFANRNKLSPGRTVAQVVANDNPTVSGVVDGTWRMLADPFLVGGKFLKSHRLSRALPTDSIGAALPVVTKRLGGFVEETDDLGTVFTTPKFVEDVADVAARANDEAAGKRFVNLVDYRSYNNSLRKLDATKETKALIELVDHVFAHDGRFLTRYQRMRPGNAALAAQVNDLRLTLQRSGRNLTPEQQYRLAAQEIHDNLLPAALASGLGYTRRTQGAFMPRLTASGYAKAQVAPKLQDVIDWTMAKAPVRLMDGANIGVDDYEAAEATLDELVRYLRADDVLAGARLEDFGIMRKVLEDKKYAPDVIADTLTKRVLVDIGVNEAHGMPMDALARYAMSQGDPATPVYDRIVEALRSLEDLDESIEAQHLVDAFDEAVNRYQEVFAALPDRNWAIQGLLQDGRFNTDLHELTSIFRGTWMEYAARKAIIPPEEVKRLQKLYGDQWKKHVVNPANADTRGVFTRLVKGRRDPTGGAAGWDEFYEDVIAPLAQRGSFRKITEFLQENKGRLAEKYDQEMIETLHFRLQDFRWDDSVSAARYQVDLPMGPRYIDNPDAYEEQLTGVLAKWQKAEIDGLEQDRAVLQSKLQWLTDPHAFAQLGLAAVAKAGRGLTLFARKVPKFGYVPFHGEHALGEFQKFLDMGVYGRKARDLAKDFVNTTDAGRRSVLFAAKRQLLHDTGILFNTHAQDFVLSQLYEADFYYGGLRWIDNQGHARMSALLPDVQTADAMAIPDIELIAYNADRNKLMSLISPVNGELSHLTKRFNHAFKQAAVFAPRLILRAGGLDETLSVVARHGLRDTSRIYAQSTLGRVRASTLSRDVQRTSALQAWARRGQSRLAAGDKLPEAHYLKVASVLGTRESFVRRWDKVRAIDEYRAATRGSKTDVDRYDAAVRGLKRLGLEPEQIDEAVSPAWIEDMIGRQRTEHALLQAKIDAGEIPDILSDRVAFRRWVEETELEGMFDARVPVRENTGPGLHDAARWYGRFADRLINVGNKMGLHMDEDMLRAMNRLATDPLIIHAYNKNVTQTSIVGTLVDLDPTQPISFEEVETLLRLRDDSGDFSAGLITDYLGMQYMAVTGQMLNASDLANIPAWGFMGMPPLAERKRIGALLQGLDLPRLTVDDIDGLGDPYRGGATRWHRLFQTVGEIDDPEARAFAAARARFAMAPPAYKQLVWDILDDAPNMRYAEINPTVIAAEWRDFLRGHGLDPDEFGVDEDMVTQLTDFFVRSDRNAGNLVAWNDEAFRPSVAYANANALRAADAGVFFHGNSTPLQNIKRVDELIPQMFNHRMAMGPGLYLSQNAPYSAGYAYTAQQLHDVGGTAVMNRLRLKPDFADHRIMHALKPTPEDRAQLREVLEGVAALDPEAHGTHVAVMRELRLAAETALAKGDDLSYDAFWDQMYIRLAPHNVRRDDMAYVGKVVKESFFDEFGRRGYAAFTDHDWVSSNRHPRLGDPFDADEHRHVVVFLDNAVDIDDPVNYSMTAEAVEAEMLQVDPTTGRSRYDDEVDDWAHWVVGDFDPDAGMQRIIEAQYRDLLRPERQKHVKRHDMVSPDNDVRYNRSEDFVTVFVPRSKVGHSRLILDEEAIHRGDQFMADAQASQAVLDANATPSTYDILGSTDPAEAQRLLHFYSNGRPQDWDMVEVVVSKDDWVKRNAAFTKDDPRRAYVFDNFRSGRGASVPASRTIADGDLPNLNVAPDVEATSDPFRQLFAVNKAEIDQAPVVTGTLGQAVEQAYQRNISDSVNHHAGEWYTFEHQMRTEGIFGHDAASTAYAERRPDDFFWMNVSFGLDRSRRTPERLRSWQAGGLTDEELVRALIRDPASSFTDVETRLMEEALDARIAAGQPIVPDWLTATASDPGYRPVLAGKRTEQGISELADQMVKSLRAMMTDSQGIAPGQYLGPITRGRFKADMIQDFDVMGVPTANIRPRMNAARYGEPDGTFNAIQSLRKARDNGFDMIGRGIAEMSRTPQFLRAYGDALRDAKAFRRPSQRFDRLNTEMADLFGDDFDDLREVLNAELGYATTQISTYAQVKDIADGEWVKMAAHFGVDLDGKPDALARFKDWAAGELAWQNLEHSQAMTAALRKTSMFIDDSRVRSQFAQLFDVIWPFTYATEQFLARWVNTSLHSPETFRRMALYYQGFHAAGIITEDAQGNDVYEIPFSGQLTKGLAWASQILPKRMEIDPDLVPGVNMIGRIEYTFAGTTDPLQLSAGPTLALPLAALRPLAPDVIIPFEELLISELGQGNSPLETVLPSTLGRFTGALPGNVDHGLTIAAMQYVSAYAPHLEPTWTENEDGTIDGPTPAELDEYRMEVERAARILHLARGITGLFSPAAPQFNLDPDNLSEEFTQYLEAGVPIEEAVGQFLAEHPGATAYTISKTDSAGGAPIDPSQETLETINQHREFFDAYDLAGPYLLPHSGGEADFDPIAWGELQAINYKTYRTGKEWYRAYSFAVGARQYFPMRDFKNQALATEGLSPDRKAAIKLIWKNWTADFFAKYPLFADEVSSQEATRRRANVRRDMRKALDDPALPESENASIIRSLLVTYETMEHLLADDRKYDSDQRRAARTAFHTYATNKVRGNFMAQAFYDRVILRDLDVEDQPFGNTP